MAGASIGWRGNGLVAVVPRPGPLQAPVPNLVQCADCYLRSDFTGRRDVFRVQVKNWVKELRKMLGQDICLAICGNKMDMEKNRRVDQATAERYAASVGAVHFHTSAKQDKGIGEMFLDLSKREFLVCACVGSFSSALLCFCVLCAVVSSFENALVH